MKKAIVLLSGGMDSAVAFYIARRTYQCHVLVFDYGQKAKGEIDYALKLSEMAGCENRVLKISLPWKGSSLLDENKAIPDGKNAACGEIPDTYVPARNIIFLSYAVSFAEAINAEAVFIGAHQLDFSNYPDCRSEFFNSMRKAILWGTKKGSEGDPVEIITPIIDMTKKEIVELGVKLGVPFEHTWSCYKSGERPCLECESCMFRQKAFEELGIQDPLLSKMDTMLRETKDERRGTEPVCR